MKNRLKVLIVEDDLITAFVHNQMLKESGYKPEIAIATNLKNILQVVDKFAPDIILMDIELSDDMDGFSLSEIICKRINVPIIYVTGRSDFDAINLAKSKNVYGYLIKPLTPETVCSTIEISYTKFCYDLKIKENEATLRNKTIELECLYKITKQLEAITENPFDAIVATIEIIFNNISFTENSGLAIRYKAKTFKRGKTLKRHLIYDIPFSVRNVQTGNILVYYKSEAQKKLFLDFENFPHDKKFFKTIASHLENCIEKIIAAEDLKRLEREIIEIGDHERRKIGYELHDGLGQILTAMSFMVRRIRNHYEKKQYDFEEDLCELSETMKKSIAQCRIMSRGLTPIIVDNTDFAMSLYNMTESLSGLYHAKVFIDSVGEDFILPPFITTQLCLIIKECVNNSFKHAATDIVRIKCINKKTHAEIIITDQERLELSDDDKYIDKKTNIQDLRHNRTPSNSMGMSIMKYRADLIDAEIDFIADKTSLKVFITVPMKEAILKKDQNILLKN